tara:strand:+ start:708 stop:995 length:288 start_codon:yes stop_codon:yes gene_type:complete
MTTRFEATVALNSGKCVFQDGDIGLFIDDVKVIDFTEIDKKVLELQAEYDTQEYTRNRKTDYPDIGDQLDALYHAGVFPANMAARIKETKDKYPK